MKLNNKNYKIMHKINENYALENETLIFLNSVETPKVSVTLSAVVESDDKENIDRFLTIVYNKETTETTKEYHFDIDHLFNNLLTYGLSLSLIEVLMENELGLASFSVTHESKEVLKFIKKDKVKHILREEAMDTYWKLKRDSYVDKSIVRKRYLK